MRIGLIALTDYRRFPTGGILSFVKRFLESAAEVEGVTTTLVGWSPRSETREFVDVGNSRLEFHSVCEAHSGTVLPDRLQFYGGRDRWKRVLSAVGDVDVYYCHSPESALRASQDGCGAPIALHLHGTFNTIGRSRFTLGRFRPVAALYESFVLSSAVRRASAIFATVSDSDYQAFLRRNLARDGVLCQRIPAMVALPARAPSVPSEESRIRLVCVGRMEPIKGFDLVLLAARRLMDRGTPCELRIIGEGSDRERLQRLASDLDLGKVARFLGSLTQDEVYRELAESHVFVSGSHQEGFSLALLEALAMGIPAVVTDVGSAREVIRDDVTGFVVEKRDPDLVASCIATAAAARWRMREACEGAARRYSRERVSSGILESLDRITRSAN
jgi:glycosyltransferase involved in cell wall biosynthesis